MHQQLEDEGTPLQCAINVSRRDGVFSEMALLADGFGLRRSDPVIEDEDLVDEAAVGGEDEDGLLVVAQQAVVIAVIQVNVSN